MGVKNKNSLFGPTLIPLIEKYHNFFFDSLFALKKEEGNVIENFDKFKLEREPIVPKLLELMTECQVVEWLQLKNVRQLRRLCLSSGLPYLPIKKKEKRFDRKEIVAWMKKNRRIAVSS